MRHNCHRKPLRKALGTRRAALRSRSTAQVIQIRTKTGASCITSACIRMSPEPKSQNTAKSYTEKPEQSDFLYNFIDLIAV
jgi:hypothetical protein